MNATTKKKIADGIVIYILANEPVTLDALEARARTKEWYAPDVFNDIISVVAKDTRLSTNVSGDGSSMTFRKRRVVVRTKPTIAEEMQERVRQLRASYPPFTLHNSAWHPALDECYCHMFHTKEAWEESAQHHTWCVKTGSSFDARTQLFLAS